MCGLHNKVYRILDNQSYRKGSEDRTCTEMVKPFSRLKWWELLKLHAEGSSLGGDRLYLCINEVL